mmetsp:Transcript_72571/g.203758  ORF Transcript_72571/g.203758 Transcript_72571/m.203758 type:complete len:348 (-) Transcript_72571:983-2026(-)
MPLAAAKRVMSRSAKFVGEVAISLATKRSCASKESGAKPKVPARNSNQTRKLVLVACTLRLMNGSSNRRRGCSACKAFTVTTWRAGASSKWILLTWTSNCVLAISVAMIAFSANRQPCKLEASSYCTSGSLPLKSVNTSPAYSSSTVTNLPLRSSSVAFPPNGAYPGNGSSAAKSMRSSTNCRRLRSNVKCIERAVSDKRTPRTSARSRVSRSCSIRGAATTPFHANTTSRGRKKPNPWPIMARRPSTSKANRGSEFFTTSSMMSTPLFRNTASPEETVASAASTPSASSHDGTASPTNIVSKGANDCSTVCVWRKPANVLTEMASPTAVFGHLQNDIQAKPYGLQP